MGKLLVAISFVILCMKPAWGEKLPKPWVKFFTDKGTATEFHYDPQSVKKDDIFIDADIIEIVIPKALITMKHIRFDPVGYRGYGQVKTYKQSTSNLVSQLDMAQGGYIFSKPNPEEKVLYRIIKKK